MKTIDDMEGVLRFVLGSGWMSRHEASRLARGMVVRTTRIAGEGYELAYNGERIADAEAVVAGPKGKSRLCARILSLERGTGIAPEPARGTEAMELVPFTVVLGEAKASLRRLAGLGATSLIDLGIPAGEPQRAELLLAGFPAASGTVGVSGENMTFRVDDCFALPAPCPEFRTSGSVIDPERTPLRVKDYDFRRPDCFTKAWLDDFAALHEDFLRSLAVLAGERENFPEGIELASVDQLNFTEFAESLAPGKLIVAAPATATVVPRMRESERPARPYLDLSSDPVLDSGDMEGLVRSLQTRPIGGAILASGDILADNRDIVFAALRDAWKSSGSLAPYPAAEFRRSETKPALALADYAEEWEMVALASFRAGSSLWLNLAYPLRTVGTALKARGK